MKNEAIANYEDAIKMMLKQEGVKATNIANHKALDLKLITLEQFRAGARILAAEIIKR